MGNTLFSNPVINKNGSAPSLQEGLDADKPGTGSVVGDLYLATDAKALYRWNGTDWESVIGSGSGVPNLQAVLDNGHVAYDNAIALIYNTQKQTNYFDANAIQGSAISSGGAVFYLLQNGSLVNGQPFAFFMAKVNAAAGDRMLAVLPPYTATGNIQQWQDDTGTIALTKNITFVNATQDSVNQTLNVIGVYETVSKIGYYLDPLNGFKATNSNNNVMALLRTDNTKGLLQLSYEDLGVVYDVTFKTSLPTGNADITFNPVTADAMTGVKTTVTLSSGQVTYSDAKIKSTSHCSVELKTVSGTMGTKYRVLCASGSVTITSVGTTGITIATDNSTISIAVWY